MSYALNPDAPVFISSQRNTVHYAPLQLSLFPNPNPYLSFSSYPICFETQTPYETGIMCTYPPPQSFLYQYYSFPLYCSSAMHQLIFPSGAPPRSPAPTVRTCSIQELDETTGATSENETVETPTAVTSTIVVLNRRRGQARKGDRSVVRASPCPEQRRRTAIKVPHQLYEISEDANSGLGGKTTLMIKNLPSKFSKKRLLAILRDHCVEENQKACASEGEEAVLSAFDYLYLPIDFRTYCNFGYAFVNFTSPIGAWRLYKHLHNHKWISCGSNKKCEVNFARIQGLEESIKHVDSIIFHWRIPEAFLPVHFEPPFDGLNNCVACTHGRRM